MSTYTHDYTAEYLSLFAKSGVKRQITDAAVLAKIGAAPASHVNVHASDITYGHVKASSVDPEPNGVAYCGEADEYARADHVHPAQTATSAQEADFAKALKNPFMLYLEGAVTAEDRVDGNTDVHLRIIKLDANALEGMISLDNLPVGTDENSIAAGNHTHTKSQITDFSHTHTGSEITDLSTILSGYSVTSHTHDYSNTYAAKSHQHALTDITSAFPNAGVMVSTGATSQPTSKAGSANNQFLKYTTGSGGTYAFSAIAISDVTNLQTTLDGKAATHNHPYLPLAGGAMESTCVLCTDILENRGWYFGLVNNSSNYDFSSGGKVTINTKIGASDNTTGLGDYCIRIRGYLVSNSSKTIDLFVYLSNTSSNTATVDVVTAHGYRNYGSINPGTLHIFKRNTTSGDGIKIYFTIPSDDRGTFAMNVDLISHDLAKENITNTSSPNSSDNKLLHGWTISNTIVPSGTYLECDSISTHAHEALSVGNGLKYASGDSYTGADARTISVKEDYAFNWAGIHTFTVVPKINLTGVLIGRGSSTQIDAKSGSANRQFLKYTVSNNVGAYGFAAIVKEDLPNISGLNSGASSAGQLLVSGSNGSAAWFPIGLTGQVLQQTSSGLQFKYIHERTTLPLTSSHTSSNPATFTHTAGTDQTVYLILPTDSTATTSFYVRIQSPNSEWAGDKIQFIVINNVTTSPDTYNPIVYFKKYDSNNDKYIGDYGYDSAGIAESALSIASGFMMNLYCVTVGAATIWRAQRISEIGFDQN